MAIAIVFKDLQKVASHSQQRQEQQYTFFERLRGKPFWIWNVEEHKQQDIKTDGDCCFNHIIGLPTKGRIEKPLFDYEKLLYDSLFLINDDDNNINTLTNHTFNHDKHKHLWVKKSTGLGVTEFFLRLMA